MTGQPCVYPVNIILISYLMFYMKTHLKPMQYKHMTVRLVLDGAICPANSFEFTIYHCMMCSDTNEQI